MKQNLRIPDWPISGPRERELLDQVLASPQWGGFHPIVAEFEQQFAAFQHADQCVTATNGTLTLEAGFSCSGLAPGDEIIVPAISFVSTATAISRAGLTPVFADIEPYSFNLDPARAEAAIGPRTRAICIVHFGGPLANIDAFVDLARRRNLLLFEDAAHAQGSEWRGRRAGSFGLWSSFSFQNGKVLTAGEGGALLTSDPAMAASLRSFVNQGRRAGEGFFHHYSLGTNGRLTAFQAAVLTAQLERLPEQIALRARNESLIRSLVADAPGLTLQQVLPEVNAHSHYLLLGRIDAALFGETRDAFHARLTVAGIPCTPFYPHTLYNNPLYREGVVPCRVTTCPNAEATITDAFWLPHRALMADEESTRAIAAVLSAAVPESLAART